MKETGLRLWHARTGLLVAFFILLQTLTGVILGFLRWMRTVEVLPDQVGYTGWAGLLRQIHYGAWPLGTIYHLLLGLGLIWMVFSGGWIFLQMRNRRR
jgi:hypothetical protein